MKSNKLKLCFVSDFFVPHYQGGGERRYYEILKKLVKRGHKVDLVCMKIKGAEDYENIDGINVFHIGPTIETPPNRGLFDFLRFSFAAFSWIMSRDYDIIEAQGIGLLSVSLAGLVKKAKSVAVVHDLSSGKSDQWFGPSKLSEFGEKMLIRLPFNRIINVSQGVKNRMIKEYNISPNKITVVHNGVDLDYIDGVKEKSKEKNTVVFVGRLIPHKHVNDLIKAVSLVKKKIPNVKLKIIGTGPEMKKLERFSTSLKMGKIVKFFGKVEDHKDVVREIKKANLLVLPSTREGFGIVLAEAFACHVPCIAYYSDGVVEVIANDVNGYLIKQRDIKELANKIEFLLKNKKKAKQFVKKGRKKTEDYFEWNAITTKIEKLYYMLIRS